MTKIFNVFTFTDRHEFVGHERIVLSSLDLLDNRSRNVSIVGTNDSEASMRRTVKRCEENS